MVVWTGPQACLSLFSYMFWISFFFLLFQTCFEPDIYIGWELLDYSAVWSNEAVQFLINLAVWFSIYLASRFSRKDKFVWYLNGVTIWIPHTKKFGIHMIPVFSALLYLLLNYHFFYSMLYMYVWSCATVQKNQFCLFKVYIYCIFLN